MIETVEKPHDFYREIDYKINNTDYIVKYRAQIEKRFASFDGVCALKSEIKIGCILVFFDNTETYKLEDVTSKFIHDPLLVEKIAHKCYIDFLDRLVLDA